MSPKLKRLSGKEVLSILSKFGFTMIRLIKNVTKIRITAYLLVALCCIFGFSELKAESKDVTQATVNSESLTVFSRASSKSEIVKTLRKGDVVNVEFELEGTDGSWCGIIEEGQTSISGYVQCQYLNRQPQQKKSWTSLNSSGDRERNSGKPSPSAKLRPYSDITVILYMTSW